MASLESIHARCVRTEDGCLIWQGAITVKTGYSRIGHEGETLLGHRLVFTLAVRPLEPGEHVDHLCHNGDSACVGGRTCVHRRCLEPSHLEAVTQAENNRRAWQHASRTPGSKATNALRGTCKKGLHPWVPENIGSSTRGEFCRCCRRETQRAYERRVAEREGRTVTDRPRSRKS
jgi:hypothetical protein